MKAFMAFMESKVMPVTQKIAAQRHLLAVRNGILSTLPLTIVGSFFAIFLNIPINGYNEWIEPFREVLDVPFRFTVGMMALYAAFGVGASLATSYRLNQLSAGLLSVIAFLISSVVPVQVNEPVKGVIEAGRYLSIGDLSATSLFGAIVTSLIAVEIYHRMIKHNISIKLPDSVPPAVANSFSALLPALAIILLFWGIRYGIGFDLNSMITFII